jgi:hypothetical protein
LHKRSSNSLMLSAYMGILCHCPSLVTNVKNQSSNQGPSEFVYSPITKISFMSIRKIFLSW